MHETLGEQLNREIAELISEVGADTNPWERRFARKLAIAGATAVLLSELGIGPWTKDRARRAFRLLYRKARKAAATLDEIAEGLTTRIRQLLSEDSFPELRKGKELTANTLARAKTGFLKELPGIGKTLVMPLAHVEKLVERGAIFSVVVQHLANKGFVHLGDDGKATRQVLVKGLAKGRPRYVCFDLAALKAAKK
jgi:hypothetical protein